MGRIKKHEVLILTPGDVFLAYQKHNGIPALFQPFVCREVNTASVEATDSAGHVRVFTRGDWWFTEAPQALGGKRP